MFYFLVLLLILIVVSSAYLSYKKTYSKLIKLPDSDTVTFLVNIKDVNYKGTKNNFIVTEKFFSKLYTLLESLDNNTNNLIILELLAHSKNVYFYITLPSNILNFVESLIYKTYPSAHIINENKVLNKYNDFLKNAKGKLLELKLKKKSYLPIKTFEEFDNNKFKELLNFLATKITDEDLILMQYVLLPAKDTWQKEGYNYISELNSNMDNMGIKFIQEHLSSIAFKANVKVFVFSKNSINLTKNIKLVCDYFNSFSSSLNSFEINETFIKDSSFFLDTTKRGLLKLDNSFILTTKELSSIICI